MLNKFLHQQEQEQQEEELVRKLHQFYQLIELHRQ